jgi:hypothetical protein
MKKGSYLVLSAIFFLMLLSIPFVHSAQEQIIQVPTDQKPASKNPFDSTIAFFKMPLVWWIIGIFLLVLLFGVGIFFFVRWIVKFLKQREDIFYRIRQEKLKLSKAQKTYPSTSWFHYEKNTPIRLLRQNADGKPFLTRPIAYHRGDYTTHEGNIVIAFNMKGNEIFWIIPRTELIVIPNKSKVEIQTRNSEGKTETITIDNLPTAKDIVQFNENEIILHAESICNTGYFYVPVVKTKEGKIIDLSVPVYSSFKAVALESLLYEQTDEFVKIAKKSIDLNPNLRYQIKSADANQSIEVPSGQGGR